MKVCESWLREWVNPAITTTQLAELLTMAGLEVDSISPVAGDFSGVIVARVCQTKPHPAADRLTLCEVDPGNGQLLQVVCGAKNVRAGLIVALAQMGALLPQNMAIKETKLRGELSQGMLCSASELGLTDTSEGILELAEDAPLGMDFRDYLELDDWVLDIDLTPNRADCLSVLGVARELAAITSQSLKVQPEIQCTPSIDETRRVQIQEKHACPHYCGRIIRQINSQAVTPLWMKERLRRAGIRAIHPVVDVGNYVMLELGQPLHAFDEDVLEGNVQVRFAHDGEHVKLLDGGAMSTLTANVLVIADESQVLALAGVMGGASSAVTCDTTSIFLESAFFDPSTVAGVARRFGLNSEASQRFERGVDPSIQRRALERATELLLPIVGGQAGPITCCVDEHHLPKPKVISFNPQRVQQLIGIDLPHAQIATMLRGLGMLVDETATVWQVTSPVHRFDISQDVDLIEEVVRLYGYDKIPSDKMIGSAQSGHINGVEVLLAELTAFFTHRAYHETISYSFVDPTLQELLFPETVAITLQNPISSELSSMRVSLLPGLLASMIYNRHRQQPSVKLFESGVTFVGQGEALQEKNCFAGLIIGEIGSTNWLIQKRSFDFYDLKGDLQALLASLKLPSVQFVPNDESHYPALHPGKSALLVVNGQTIGWCGVLHPQIAQELDLSDEVIAFELYLAPLLNKTRPRYQAISKFPLIRRDLSLVVDKRVNFSEIESVVKNVVESSALHQGWLKSFELFDVYVGDSIPADKKSLAVSLVLQDEQRTLVDGEINELISAIIKALGEKLAITLRD